jgi:anti-sigma-K factor RskA
MGSPSDDDILDLLAAYALGALEPGEIARVSALLKERPELRATLEELRATADQLPYALPEATPPADLRQRVLDRATGRAAPRQAPAPAGWPQRARAWVLGLGMLAAAAIVAAAAGWGQLAGARSELASARAEFATTQAQIVTAQAQLDQLQAQIATAQKVLASLEGQNGSGAVLQISNGNTIFAAQLPRLQAGRVYQLWRIPGGGAPLSAGLFTVDQQGYGQIILPPGQQPQAGETVAVTDEPDGGSPGPTTQPLIVGTSSSA